MKIWNSNLRFNMENPVYREAYDNLHEMDRRKYKSCNHVIAVAVNEYFKRQKLIERDPYFETREREERFIAEIVEEVGKAVKEAMPGFMATYIMEKSWGKEISDLAIDENEVEWVRKIFELTVNDGYGSHRIASYLKKNGVKTHNGAKFQSITIIRILRNKLYCGYIVSGEVVSPHMQELQIIDKEMFERAQYILDQRVSSNNDNRQIALTTKGRAMLLGLMFCAHCGGRLTSNVFRDTYTRADGTVRRRSISDIFAIIKAENFVNVTVSLHIRRPRLMRLYAVR